MWTQFILRVKAKNNYVNFSIFLSANQRNLKVYYFFLIFGYFCQEKTLRFFWGKWVKIFLCYWKCTWIKRPCALAFWLWADLMMFYDAGPKLCKPKSPDADDGWRLNRANALLQVETGVEEGKCTVYNRDVKHQASRAGLFLVFQKSYLISPTPHRPPGPGVWHPWSIM